MDIFVSYLHKTVDIPDTSFELHTAFYALNYGLLLHVVQNSSQTPPRLALVYRVLDVLDEVSNLLVFSV